MEPPPPPPPPPQQAGSEFDVDRFSFSGSEQRIAEMLINLGSIEGIETSQQSVRGQDKQVHIIVDMDAQTSTIRLVWRPVENGFWLVSTETVAAFPVRTNRSSSSVRDRIVLDMASAPGFVLYESRPGLRQRIPLKIPEGAPPIKRVKKHIRASKKERRTPGHVSILGREVSNTLAIPGCLIVVVAVAILLVVGAVIIEASQFGGPPDDDRASAQSDRDETEALLLDNMSIVRCGMDAFGVLPGADVEITNPFDEAKVITVEVDFIDDEGELMGSGEMNAELRAGETDEVKAELISLFAGQVARCEIAGARLGI